jgi:ribonuclease D
MEVENAAALAYAHEDVEGLVPKITLLQGVRAVERRARELAEENSCALSSAVADAERRWEVSEREHQGQFEELTLLQTWALSCASPL